jgi:hypothetical protein
MAKVEIEAGQPLAASWKRDLLIRADLCRGHAKASILEGAEQAKGEHGFAGA